MFAKLLNKYKSMSVESKASLWFAVTGFLQKGVAFITTPIFSRLLTTDEYGIYNLYSSWHNIITVFATLNLAAGVYMRGLVKYDDDRKTFTASMFELGVTCFSVVVAVYLLFFNFWNKLFDLPIYAILAIFVDIFAVMILQFWASRERVDFKYKKLVLITILASVFRPVVGIIAVLNMANRVQGRIVTIAVVDVVFYSWLIFSLLFSDKKLILSTKYWKYGLSFNLPLIPHYLSQVVLAQADRIMIKHYCTESDVGIYGMAYTVASMLLILNNAIINTLNPLIYKNIKARKFSELNKSSINYILIIALANAFLILLAPELMAIIAPIEYQPAIWTIPPISLSSYFVFMYTLFAGFEFYYEKTKNIAVASCTCAIVNIVLNTIFIPKYGYLAAGYTTLASYILYVLYHYIYMKQIIKTNCDNVRVYNGTTIVCISVAFILFTTVSMITYEHIFIRYGLIVVLLIVTYIKRNQLIKLLFGRKSRDDNKSN